jgi:signal transduction histidine kinase
MTSHLVVKFDSPSTPLSYVAESNQQHQAAEVLEAENRELRQTVQKLSDVIAFASHEWGNQMLRLSLATEKLLRQNNTFNHEQQQVIAELHDRMKAIRLSTNNYLNLSWMESTTIRLELASIDLLKEVIEPVVATYSDLLANRTLDINVQSLYNKPVLVADRSLMRAVFDNLLSNAIKYGEPNGRIVITVKVSGSKCTCNVWNSGPGLALEDHIGRMFERFAHGRAPAVGDSTGIGLYLVRKIIEAHSGKLWVESQSGAWADFIFVLPLATDAS